jgi:hypothetical protein
MRCQVSTPVAELLAAAAQEPHARLALQPRGRVSIKGKGELDTFWLSAAGEPEPSVRPLVRVSSGEGNLGALAAADLEAAPRVSRGDGLQHTAVEVSPGASV